MGGTGAWVRRNGHMEPPFSHPPTHIYIFEMDWNQYMEPRPNNVEIVWQLLSGSNLVGALFQGWLVSCC